MHEHGRMYTSSRVSRDRHVSPLCGSRSVFISPGVALLISAFHICAWVKFSCVFICLTIALVCGHNVRVPVLVLVTFCLLFAVGNCLPPQHVRGQSLPKENLLLCEWQLSAFSCSLEYGARIRLVPICGRQLSATANTFEGSRCHRKPDPWQSLPGHPFTGRQSLPLVASPLLVYHAGFSSQ